MEKRNHSSGRKPGGNATSICFLYAAIKFTLSKCFGEMERAHRMGEVAIYNNNFIIDLGKINECIAIGCTHFIFA